MSTPSDNPKDNSPESAFIPLSEPQICGNEWDYVRQCLDTGWVSSAGKFVDRFESDVAAYCGADHAIATVNGTSALHAALLAIGVEPDDEILVSSLTFIASANAIRYCGAHPVLIDSEPRYWQMDVNLVEEFLIQKCSTKNGVLINRLTGRRIKAIMPVHVLGHPVELDALLEIAGRFNLPVIEDAAESLGTAYRNRRLGTWGDVTCFSFNGNKTITAGAGGMIVTNDSAIAQRARYLTTQAKDDPVEYEHNEVGFNYRMTNVLAAIGTAQLERLDDVVQKKRQILATYRREISHPGIRWHAEAPDAFSTCWLSTAFIDPTQTGATATQLRIAMQERNIQTRRLWRPMHRNPPYANCQSVLNGTADRIAANSLSFPSSASLSQEAQRRVCTTLLDQLRIHRTPRAAA